MSTVTAVVPTYREAEIVPDVLAELREHGVDSAVVVDDSPTLATARAVRDRHPDVTVIHREADGLASAVIRGFAAAEGDTYLVSDGDGQHPPAAAAKIGGLCEASDADLVVGTRHADGGSVADAWPTHRRVISTGADAMARVAVPPARDLSDPMSGLFAVDAAVVDPVLPRLRPAGYKIILELLARCAIDDVREEGYAFQPADSDSNLGAREYVRYVRHLTRLSVPSRQAGGDREQVLTGEVTQ